MSFLPGAFKNMKKGLYMAAIGATPFSEIESKKEILYVFPYAYHAQYYRDSIDPTTGNPFKVSFWTLDRLWERRNDWYEIRVATAEPGGDTFSRDILFPTVRSILH